MSRALGKQLDYCLVKPGHLHDVQQAKHQSDVDHKLFEMFDT